MKTCESYESWGRLFHYRHSIQKPRRRSDVIDFSRPNMPCLPYGIGRSYGDSCLNDGGTLLDTAGLNRFISFDSEKGLLRCEAGVTLREILDLAVPKGWFLPVTPGTQFVTVGGAIANDIHGKNHHREGTFGCHVTRLELLRSNGEILSCSSDSNEEFFRATIGGLGLTGLILWAEIRLKAIRSAFIEQESIKFGCLEEFFRLSEESDKDFDYTVAWIDHARLGRGIFLRGNHSKQGVESLLVARRDSRIGIPFDAPGWVINRWTVRGFNDFYYRRQSRPVDKGLVSYGKFFYPLDAVNSWNRLYGKRGFFQYQCVIPSTGDSRSLQEIFRVIASSGAYSPLTVLKMFGGMPSPGLLSFPRKGITLAIDLPNEGKKTLRLMDHLDGMVIDLQGAVYPAKDARMSGKSFRKFYPAWEKFMQYKDPKFSSSFWRRVTCERS